MCLPASLVDLDIFCGIFYAAYHPFHNGNQPLIHPQPAGIGPSPTARPVFIGCKRHHHPGRVTLMEPEGLMRVYFFPNSEQ